MLLGALSLLHVWTSISAFAFVIKAAPHGDDLSLAKRQSAGKMVFCHFMIGVIDDRTSAADYDKDMQQAKSAGIDAFALNIGIDPFTETQLNYAYQSAQNNGMSVFLSFDFNWWATSNTSGIGAMVKAYANQPAQLKVDGKIFVSSFEGDGLELSAVASAAGTSIYWAPNFEPSNLGSADAGFNWMAWPNNGDNKAPDAGNNLTVSQGDQAYMSALGIKPYVAPVSAWFSTHYGPEVPYSKNWVFPSDLLWFQRWTEILTLSPEFVEIITWNDYGESHYIGPLDSPHIDDGNSKWTNDMPHDGFLSMAQPYIAAFKAGSQTVNPYIKSDQLIYWYRPTLKSASCDSTDTCEQPVSGSNPNYFIGKPNGYDTMSDSVFVVALLTSAGTVTVTSGSNSQTFNAQAGPNAFEMPMGTGKQSFALTRNGQTILSGDSLKDIISDCVCGIYNFNAYVGTLPSGPADPLQPDGLTSFAAGLHATCQATPSLGTPSSGGGAVAPAATAPTSIAASGSSPAPTTPSSTSTPNTINSPPPNSQLQPTTQQQPQSQSEPASSSPPPPPSSTPTTPATAAGGGGSKTITALAQLAPTNCMHAGYVWAGPAGSDPPDTCDGG